MRDPGLPKSQEKSSLLQRRGFRNFLPLLLTFILVDETCNNYIFNVFTLNQTSLHELVFYSIFLLLAIVASPIQAGYSDFHCRKKSLVFSLSFSFLGLIFAFFSTLQHSSPLIFLSVATFCKAAFGNNLPLSWATMADTQTKNFRFSLGLSTAMMAFGFFAVLVIKKIFKQKQFLIVALLAALVITSIYLCVKKLNDVRDKADIDPLAKKIGLPRALALQVKLLVDDFLRDRRTRKALCTFMLWEVSFYSALIIDVDMHVKGFENLSLAMLSGYLIGVLLLKFLAKKTDAEMIGIGYKISIVSLASIFLLWPFFDGRLVMLCCYFVYSLAAAFLAPSLFSILSKERPFNQHGKIYGLIDSSDTISFLIAANFVITYNYLQVSRIFLPLFSFVVFIISLWPYEKFKKTIKTYY